MSAPFYPEGNYLCEVTDQGLTKASTGTVQVVLRFKVLEGTRPQRDVKQYERTTYLAVTSKTMEYLVPKLQALGYTRDSLDFINLQNTMCHDMRGTQAEFFCKHEDDRANGLREKWDVSTSSGSKPLELKPPDPKDMRQLNTLFGRQLKNSGAVVSKPAPKPTPIAAGPQQVDDDDVPF